MSLLYSATATATVAANTNSITIAGMDLSAVLPGMVLNLGARDRVTGDGYIISDVAPAGSSGGTLKTVGPIPTAFNAAAFVVDTRDFNGSASNFLVAMYTTVFNVIARLTGSATTLLSGSRALALDKDSASAVSRLLYAIGGRTWFSAEQRTLTYTPTGGAQTSSETLALRAYADGTIPTDAILIDGTTGGVDVLVTSASMVAAQTTDLGSAPTGKVTITNSGGSAISIASFGPAKHKIREIHFPDAGVTLVHSASLSLPGGANILVQAGDMLRVSSDVSGNWRVRQYQRADGTPLAGALNQLRFDVAQALTAAQKTQGQTNLGAGAAGASVFGAATLSALKSFLSYTAADVGALSVVAASLGLNGYIKFSNGFIIQWGRNAGSGSSRNVTYSVSFPNACFTVNASMYNSNAADTTLETVHIGSFDQFGFFGYPRFSAGTSGVNVASEPFSWIALGI